MKEKKECQVLEDNLFICLIRHLWRAKLQENKCKLKLTKGCLRLFVQFKVKFPWWSRLLSALHL